MRNIKRKLVFSVIIKSLGFAAGVAGLLVVFLQGDHFMGAEYEWLYFTIQSNLWIALMMGLALIFALFQICGKDRAVPPWFWTLKFVFTVSISLTFLVFAILLAPVMGLSYLLGPSNILLHYLAPLLAIADFLLFDHTPKKGYRLMVWGFIPPLYYLVFAVTLSLAGVTFTGAGDRVPYYFLNFYRLGWFRVSSAGIGVAYWIMIMLGLVFGIETLLLFLKKKIFKN